MKIRVGGWADESLALSRSGRARLAKLNPPVLLNDQNQIIYGYFDAAKSMHESD